MPASPPTRIVSLVPSATGILLALGQGDHLVGRTDFDQSEAVAHLPSVGGGLGPSMERLVALDPDLVVLFQAESDTNTPRQLDAAGIPHVAIRPDRIADVREIILTLGAIVQEPERADSIRAAVDFELDEVAGRVEAAPRPRVAFLGGNPPTVAGPGTFLHELVEIAGGQNAFADVDVLYAPVSIEEILRRDLDLILATEGATIPQALSDIPVHRVPVTMLNPGLEVGESARLLVDIIHPESAP